MTKKTQLSLQDQTSEFLLYTAPNGEVKSRSPAQW
ncbi:hypothetical protein DFP80_10883 [Marinomonas rhizomae]|uniref:Uncharacterized protein n=1 Tax=Marinomonas rhizomae TaxID=491948 RepID=A0A366J6E3_9GAMM|nr:hypothetical protein DFP80_10883 [Marinomonas rhizomae]